jgi:hypothetical protein
MASAFFFFFLFGDAFARVLWFDAPDAWLTYFDGD